MFKTSESIIIFQLDLFSDLFHIMISITKGKQHRITYLSISKGLCVLCMEMQRLLSRVAGGDARSGFGLGYMNACKGFGLFMASWVVVGVAQSFSFALCGLPISPFRPWAAPTGPFLLTYFLFPSARYQEWSDEQIFTHDFQNLVFILPVLKARMMTC